MTLLDSWRRGGISVPWAKLAKTNRDKLFRARRTDAEYYIIGGQRPKNNKNDNDELVILEVADDGTGRILIDIPACRSEKLSERLKVVTIDVDVLSQALGFAVVPETTEASYDPARQYVVDRAKVGRPHRVLTPEEQANIKKLRAQGMSINAIAKELGINNRRVMECCKNS